MATSKVRPRGAAVVAAALAVVLPAVAVPLAAAPGVGYAAVPPAPGPLPGAVLPPAVEEFSPWLPQVSCDPKAKPGVRAFADMMLATWGRGHTAALTRACGSGGPSEHKEGRAWDWGLDPDNYVDVVAGARAISWLLANDAVNARRVGIMYIIWNKRIWSSYRRAEGWRPYTYGDPHTSHIHISFSWSGAMKRTSWWTGTVAPTEYGPCIPVVGEYAPPYGDTINLDPCPPPKKAGTKVTAQDTTTSARTFTPPPAP